LYDTVQEWSGGYGDLSWKKATTEALITWV
jgi:hypothetical protein